MNEPVPYIVHESIVSRLERTIKRLFILLIVTVVLIFASNAVWIYFWNQYEKEKWQSKKRRVRRRIRIRQS